jgi:glucose-6-phosphate-specific signal transduction histidine kinase
MKKKSSTSRIISIIRNTARVWSALSVAFFLIFIFGHLFAPEEGDQLPTLIDAIAMLFFPVGVTIGLIVSWKKELIGAVTTIVSILMFYILIIIPRSAYAVIPTTLIITGPAFLFLICWFLSRKK